MENKRILRTLQHLCLDEFKMNLYCYDKFYFSGNSSGTFWSALYYQIEGEMEFQMDYYTIKIKAGDFFYIPEKCRYIHISTTAPVKFYIVSFSFRKTEGNYFDSKYEITKLSQHFNTTSIKTKLDEMFNNFIKNDNNKLLAVASFYNLFAETLPYLDTNKPFNLHPVVQKAIEYINQHLTENMPVKTIADYCFISESRLFHLFNKQLKISPINYRNHMRIKASFVLLTTTNLSIEEIARELNFGSATHFRNAFRKTTNSTPKKYRKIFKQCH